MRFKFSPFYIISTVPMGVLYLISDFLFVMAFHIVKYRRNVVQQNLQRAFPEKGVSEIQKTEKDFYKYFCDIMVESIKMLTMSKDAIKKRFRIKNLELLEQCYHDKHSIILYAAHHGNWEWMCFLPLFVPHQVITLYQPLSNGYFDELMKHVRSRFGVICVESNRGYRTLVKYKQENKLTLSGVIGDQCPSKNSAKYWTRFFNQDTAFLKGADRIIEKTKQVALFPSFKKIKRGVYELEFKTIYTPNGESNEMNLIDKYANVLEESIQQAPEMWLWSHRRWKLSPTT